MKIVIEYVLIENFLINLIVLKTTSLFTKEKIKFGIIFSILGACLTLAIPLFALSAIGYVLVEVGQVVLCVSLCFRFNNLKKFFAICGCYFLSVFLYGGVCFFVEQTFGTISTIYVLVVVAMMFYVLQIVNRFWVRKKDVQKFCFDIKIESQGKTVDCKGFLDTGNLLFDPVTESPVSLVNLHTFFALFGDIEIVDVLMKTNKVKKLKFAHYINFNTLNCDDKILVFQVDSILIDGKKKEEKVILGLCLKDFNNCLNSDVILHNSFAF